MKKKIYVLFLQKLGIDELSDIQKDIDSKINKYFPDSKRTFKGNLWFFVSDMRFCEITDILFKDINCKEYIFLTEVLGKYFSLDHKEVNDWLELKAYQIADYNNQF